MSDEPVTQRRGANIGAEKRILLQAQVDAEVGLGRVNVMLEEHLADPASMVGLVVDDMQKHTAASHLRRCSINVVELGPLAEAFAILAFRPFHIPLVDLQLLLHQLSEVRVQPIAAIRGRSLLCQH